MKRTIVALMMSVLLVITNFNFAFAAEQDEYREVFENICDDYGVTLTYNKVPKNCEISIDEYEEIINEAAQMQAEALQKIAEMEQRKCSTREVQELNQVRANAAYKMKYNVRRLAYRADNISHLDDNLRPKVDGFECMVTYQLYSDNSFGSVTNVSASWQGKYDNEYRYKSHVTNYYDAGKTLGIVITGDLYRKLDGSQPWCFAPNVITYYSYTDKY